MAAVLLLLAQVRVVPACGRRRPANRLHARPPAFPPGGACCWTAAASRQQCRRQAVASGAWRRRGERPHAAAPWCALLQVAAAQDCSAEISEAQGYGCSDDVLTPQSCGYGLKDATPELRSFLAARMAQLAYDAPSDGM